MGVAWGICCSAPEAGCARLGGAAGGAVPCLLEEKLAPHGRLAGAVLAVSWGVSLWAELSGGDGAGRAVRGLREACCLVLLPDWLGAVLVPKEALVLSLLGEAELPCRASFMSCSILCDSSKYCMADMQLDPIIIRARMRLQSDEIQTPEEQGCDQMQSRGWKRAGVRCA